MDLHREFPGRRDDQDARRGHTPRAVDQPLEYGQDKRCRLPRAGDCGAADVPAGESEWDGLWIYEGALSFVTGICCIYRDSPYKREWGRDNDRRPSSRRAGGRSRCPADGAVEAGLGRQLHLQVPLVVGKLDNHTDRLAVGHCLERLFARKVLGWPNRMMQVGPCIPVGIQL